MAQENAVKHGIYRRFFKRTLDVVLSICAIVVLSFPMIVLAVLVRIKLGTPVIFRQKRPGLNEKIFTMYKFRTMTDKKDQNGQLLPDSERLTPFGKMLRSTSLDELPELFNILRGDMSIVGPRPLLVEYLERYNDHQKRRHEVKPGLTGSAQVSGRNALKWEDKFILDVDYVDHIRFIKDVKIIVKTFMKVVIREGIHSKQSDTMEYFTGSYNEQIIAK